MQHPVKAWQEEVLIPTYGIGLPEKNPMFLEKRVYQGSSGVVYPYPVIEKIENTSQQRPYQAVFLENKYLKIMILPELGGRIQMAYDKIKERHFVYYNHVIKPALVGLTGPWISGGIEFNWPQHHRPSTYLPVDFQIENKKDGSAIVWIHERERMFHQKGTAGFKLSPGRAVLEILGRVYNPTPIPQTFLWWANPAVSVNEHYQSVFPGDVNAVFDHGKRDVSSFPVAKGTYYKMDYSEGVDISKYKNIPVPTSYMAIYSKYDFVGGYENDSKAGVLHVANHYISPGKKQWTWGHGDFGQAWDRNLTDSDGPYIELMAGVYTDNQPDFTWLQPYEEKTFTQYFLPYRELGRVKNASADLLMNMETEGKFYRLKIFATSLHKRLSIKVKKENAICLDTQTDLSPEQLFEAVVAIADLKNIQVSITSFSGKCLLYWEPETEDIRPLPEPAQAVLDPTEMSSTEELYLIGLHLEQYRHATYNPTDYYLEAIRREPTDVRNNNAMGLWLFRRGQFAKAELYFRSAVNKITQRNPNPYDGEPFYNLGLSLKYQGKYEEAYAAFYKACWNGAWQDAGYYSLAQISCLKGNLEAALEEINKSLIRNWHNHRARHLKTILLARLDQKQEALSLIEESLKIDPFNSGCAFEKQMITKTTSDRENFCEMMRRESHNYTELLIDYAQAGCWEEALSVCKIALEQVDEPELLLYYLQSWCLIQIGKTEEATTVIYNTEQKNPALCFPNQLEAILALEAVINLVNHTPKAAYLLGNLWYDKRQYTEAMDYWERSIALDDTFPTAFRNLSLAYFNKLNKKEAAVELLEKAYALDPKDARIMMELDQLYKRLNRPHPERLSFLESNWEIVCTRDDLYLEYCTLLNQLNHYKKAIHLLDQRTFHPWEGGEGKVPAQYQLARVELAKHYLQEKEYEQALRLLTECQTYPPHLGEGKLYGAQENDFEYYKGCALEGLGKHKEALLCFEKASLGNIEPAVAQYYNDQKPDKIFYQGMALYKLSRKKEAYNRFNKLISFGEKHLFDLFKMDYFAVSLPDLQIWEEDMNKKNQVHCYYLMGLGHLGLGHYEKAGAYLHKAASLDNNHQGVQIHLHRLKK